MNTPSENSLEENSTKTPESPHPPRTLPGKTARDISQRLEGVLGGKRPLSRTRRYRRTSVPSN